MLAPAALGGLGKQLLYAAAVHLPTCRRARGVDVRALVFINPGNPTGQCLTEVRGVDGGLGGLSSCACLYACLLCPTPRLPCLRLGAF